MDAIPANQEVITNKYTVYIATSDNNREDKFARKAKYSYAWGVYSNEDLIHRDSTYGKALEDGYHTAGLVRQLAAALGHLPSGSEAFIISDVEYFTNELSRPFAQRISSNYMRSNGKIPLADKEELERLDSLLRANELQISAGKARSDLEVREFGGWKSEAKGLAWWEGKPPRK